MEHSASSDSQRFPAALPPSQLRLPCYRSYQNRYHPYVRGIAHSGSKDLMVSAARLMVCQTVDYRCHEGTPYRSSLALSVVEEEDEEIVHHLIDLVPALNGEQSTRSRNKLRRLGLVELVISLAFAMRRRLQRSQKY
ncbi:uncharacterized protein FIBRA_03488 [Fibroporia radiculosa]|uniref:Uncharacterized protein n=1 Tax=Fibroporia radiculosa TaxID=599839 RepID=J4I9M8_9APHY|nr:uncharacterized protein FIBRA_03488 [Fibroporia radiculosa]CCM01436.1 predicted protein [Fibroporia radiculosa]